jgi:hypothetical protein
LPIVRARQLVQRALVFLQAKRERTCHRQQHALPNPMRGQILKVRYEKLLHCNRQSSPRVAVAAG